MNCNRLKEEEKEIIRSDYKNKVPTKEIAIKINRGVSTVGHFIHSEFKTGDSDTKTRKLGTVSSEVKEFHRLRFKKWITEGKDLHEYADSCKITRKTKPTMGTLYYWYKKITGKSYESSTTSKKTSNFADDPKPSLQKKPEAGSAPVPVANEFQKAKDEAELEGIHLKNRELKAKAEIAEAELTRKLKENARFEKENRLE